MEEMSRLGSQIGWSIKYSLCLVQLARPSLHFNIFSSLLHMHVGLIFIFQADPVSGYICAP
jgi:hypothetical protein